MATNELLRFREQILAGSPVFLIGRHRVLPQNREDYATLTSGLSIWGCILLDQCDLIGYRHGPGVLKGRIRKVRLSSTGGVIDLTPSFEFIERCYDTVLTAMSSRNEFKAHSALIALKSETACGSAWFPECIRAICTALLDQEGEFGEAQIFGELLQSLSFLRKVELDRPDLEQDLFQEFISYENERLVEVVDRLDDPTTQRIIDEMNALARSHCLGFTMTDAKPKHGPGAVSSPKVKSWYDKYQTMRTDKRIEFLLRIHDLGTMSDYNPVISPELSDRQSRFIGVPKTWKKLRGIAAEPVELQFFQQAVFRSMDDMFRRSKWWRSRVDLHRQEFSQELAIQGSLTGRLATIDLSAASDSVTLELVRRVFKGTPLLPWLLGTRCTTTLVGNQAVRLAKFASMGSACCFPVECAVFTLAAQVASDRTPGRLVNKTRTVRVFGDDIIVESVTVPVLLDVLSRLGFKVNTEKSYWDGSFREACGTFAFSGVDIRPIRYKSGSLMPDHRSLSYEECASRVGLINQLHWRGYHETRRWVLDDLLYRKVQVGRDSVNGSDALRFTFDGEKGTVASFLPTNFHLKERWNPWLQRSEFRSVQWIKRVRTSKSVSEKSDIASHIGYVEWLIAHQGNDGREDDSDYPWFEEGESFDIPSRLEIGYAMIPTRKWVVVDAANSLRAPRHPV